MDRLENYARRGQQLAVKQSEPTHSNGTWGLSLYLLFEPRQGHPLS
jgi:hypothetical protein